MVIENGRRVSLKVRMFDAQGNLLEQTDAPLVYLHGAGDIFPRIEALLAGQEAGFSGSVLLEPEEAFGEFDAQRVHLVRVADLGGNVAVGLRYEGLPGQADGCTYLVTDVAEGFAVLDGNHPLAGRALRFDIEVLAVQEDDDADAEPASPFDLRAGPAPTLQ